MKRSLRQNEEGLGTVEKLLIVALFAFAAAAGMRLLSTGSNNKSAEQGESIATTNSVIGATGEAPASLPTASPILDSSTELPISDALIPSTTATISEAGGIPSTTARIAPGADIPRGATIPARPGGPEVASAEPVASGGLPGITAAAILGEGFASPFPQDSTFVPGAEYRVAEAGTGIVSDAIAPTAAVQPAGPGSGYVPGQPGPRDHLPPPSDVPVLEWNVEATNLPLPSGESALIRSEPVEGAYCVGGGGGYACLPEPSNAEREGARLDSAVATIQDGANFQFTRLHGGPGVVVNPEGGLTGIPYEDLSSDAQAEASFQMNALGLVLTSSGFIQPQEYDGIVVGGNLGVDAFGFDSDGQVVSWDALSVDTPRPFGDRDMEQLRTDLECALYGDARSCTTASQERLDALNAVAGGQEFFDQKFFPGPVDDFVRAGLNSLVSLGATTVSPTTYEELWAAEQAAAEAHGGWAAYLDQSVVNTPETALVMVHGIVVELPNQIWEACTTSAGDCGGQVGPIIVEALLTKGAGSAMTRTARTQAPLVAATPSSPQVFSGEGVMRPNRGPLVEGADPNVLNSGEMVVGRAVNTTPDRQLVVNGRDMPEGSDDWFVYGHHGAEGRGLDGVADHVNAMEEAGLQNGQSVFLNVCHGGHCVLEVQDELVRRGFDPSTRVVGHTNPLLETGQPWTGDRWRDNPSATWVDSSNMPSDGLPTPYYVTDRDPGLVRDLDGASDYQRDFYRHQDHGTDFMSNDNLRNLQDVAAADPGATTRVQVTFDDGYVHTERMPASEVPDYLDTAAGQSDIRSVGVRLTN